MVDCPRCGAECEPIERSENVTKYECPDCDPDHQPFGLLLLDAFSEILEAAAWAIASIPRGVARLPIRLVRWLRSVR